MSIWSHHVDELEELMFSIMKQRVLSGEFVHYFGDCLVDLLPIHELEAAYGNIIGICEFLKDKLGEEYCYNVMDEAMQMFLERLADQAEIIGESYGQETSTARQH